MRYFAGAVGVLLLLGALVGFLSRGNGSGAKPRSSTSSTTDTTLPLSKALPTTLASLMGLTSAHARLVPSFSLVDQHGRQLRLSGLRGKVVVLTFLDAGCTAICPVEAAELRDGERDLGAQSADVEVLAVNLDPAHDSVADMAHLAGRSQLAPLATFHALTGPLVALRKVWAAYGVQVQVDEVQGTVLYEPLIVFIDPSGHERYLASPSGFELASGRYVVPAAQVAAFGRGIAHFATALLRSST